MDLKMPQTLFSENGERCVLLLHAYSGSPNDVRMLSRYLEKHGYSVYAPLFTGHGTLEPQDILTQPVSTWLADAQAAISFLKTKGYQQIAVFGLSMGGIFAMELLESGDAALIGGGSFCSPLSLSQNNVPVHFMKYVQKNLQLVNLSETAIQAQLPKYLELVKQQLTAIDDFAATVFKNLTEISAPVFLAQAGQDEMIAASSVFQVAEALQKKRFVLQWYPESPHVLTVGPERRQFEADVLAFLNTLAWKTDKNENRNYES
ncbi:MULTISPECIES: alpha/beta fold hydrolase [unclassified Enterococcus]|uniref:alpha/beta hydrolase n=1 Tax=unclassified Enterococcus TaxID=2608891 RepID=UPI002475DE2A|nr:MULTISPECIES: alpha/beta fold hydrolase [unclassified Enterococcus]